MPFKPPPLFAILFKRAVCFPVVSVIPDLHECHTDLVKPLEVAFYGLTSKAEQGQGYALTV